MACQSAKNIFFIFNQGVCWASGDPHYRTFDSHRYTMHGSCDYILSRALSGQFSVIATNMPCGASGSTCTKVVTVHVSDVTVKLTRGANVFVNGVIIDVDKQGQESPRFIIENVGLFVRVLVKDAGLTVLWDSGKFAYSSNFNRR